MNLPFNWICSLIKRPLRNWARVLFLVQPIVVMISVSLAKLIQVWKQHHTPIWSRTMPPSGESFKLRPFSSDSFSLWNLWRRSWRLVFLGWLVQLICYGTWDKSTWVLPTYCKAEVNSQAYSVYSTWSRSEQKTKLFLNPCLLYNCYVDL